MTQKCKRSIMKDLELLEIDQLSEGKTCLTCFQKEKGGFSRGHKKTMSKHNDDYDIISMKRNKVFFKNSNVLLLRVVSSKMAFLGGIC